ncbi:response regulator transcription factor [Tenacibaculum maritimum]|uniref:response regulator n=1 Tax=Tenacibaculum maritimum TaxID=107401 RepID=UPI0012E41F43|nr:response regulator transcription factor [Tenacibaculum maritimum]CAA0150924.1 Two-component system response regulatory protein, LuxR family [Tenacibaculum maritimum]
MTVHVADDNQIIVEGFKALFSKYNINVLGHSNNGVDLINWLSVNTVDIVILDISMPQKNGIEVINYLNNNNIKQKVIVVSAYIELQFIKDTVGNGALGYISKQFASSDIINALEIVSKGGAYFSTDVQEYLIKECLNFNTNSNSQFATAMLEKSLSPQEMKILLLHAQKYSSEDISEQLSIAKSTVRSYRDRIRNKLNLTPKKGLELRLKYLKSTSK